MAQGNNIAVDMTLDMKDFEDNLKKSETLARDTGKTLSQGLVLKMRVNIDEISQKIAAAKLELKKIDQSSVEAQKLRLDISQYSNQLTEAKRQLNNYLNTGDQTLSRLQTKFNQVTDSISKSRDELMKMGKSTSGLDQILKNVASIDDKFKSGQISIKEYEKSLLTLKAQADNVGTSFGGLKNVMIGITGLGLIQTFKDMVVGITSLGTGLEQTKIAFTSMLGSASEAKSLLNDLSNFAKTTPFEITGIRTTAKQLLAFGFSSEEIIPTLKRLGDVSAGLSVPIEQVAYAYGQVRTANQLYGTELRQFVNAGVPLLAELAKMFGVTESAVKGMVENGEVSFKDVEQAFTNMTSTGGLFNDMMAAQAQSVAGLWSNVKDTFTLIAESIGTTVLPAMAATLKSLLAFTTEFPTFTKAISILTVALVGLGGVFATLTPIIGAFAGSVAIAEIGLLPIIGTIGLAVGAIAALTGGIYYMIGGFDAAKNSGDLLNSTFKAGWQMAADYADKITELHNKQEALNKRFEEGTIGNEEYKKSTEANKVALEELAASQFVVQQGLDIINDKQTNYKQKIEALNGLKLSTAEYDKMIGILQQIQGETMKAIKLQEQLLQSKIAALQKPTTELKKATADLNDAMNGGVLFTGEGSLSTNTAKTPSAEFDLFRTNATKEYEKQVKISNQNNSAEVRKYEQELANLKKSEEDLVKIGRDAQDIIKKPVTTAGSKAASGSVNSIDNLQSKLKGLKDELGKSEIGSAAFNSLQAQIKATETAIDSAEGKAKKAGKGAEDIAKKEADKAKTAAERAAREELERKVKAIQDSAAIRVTDVKNSTASEYEKAKQIVKINEDMELAITKLKDSNKGELEMAKDIVKAEDEKNKKIKEGQDIVKSYYDKVVEGAKSANDKIAETKQKIIDLNEEIKKQSEEKDKDVAQRRLDILEREKELTKELNDLKTQGLNVDMALSLPKRMLEDLPKDSNVGGMTLDQIKKIQELNDEMKKLEEEKIKNTAALDQKTFDDLQAYKLLSKTEQILKDYETEKAVSDKKLADLQKNLATEEAEYAKIDAVKRLIETNFTAFIKSETAVRLTELDKIKQAALETAAALQAAGVANMNLNAQDVSKTGAVTNATVNQTNNFNAKVTKDDVKTIANEISKAVSNASTGIK